MNLFSYLYDKTLSWSSHQHAPFYLAGVSFAESSFFPIPPDVMLISMGLATPKKSWQYALIATLFSVLGGVFGYLLGMFFIESIEGWLLASPYKTSYLQVVQWFKYYGIWVVFAAGFSPIPYKLFTIAAGALSMPFFPFLGASLVGRGLRFFLVSSILYYLGDRLKSSIRKYIDLLGWISVLLIIVGFIVFKQLMRT